MRASVDTNILIYAFGLNDRIRHGIAVDVMKSLALRNGVMPAQALAEFHRVATAKYRRSAIEVEEQIQLWSDVFDIAPTSASTIAIAADLVTRHGLQIFDAIIIAASAQSGCRVLFSEDMQHEAVFNGVRILNPFADERHPLLLAVLR
jgi:predicted nucleic acid-binding protein